jgi:hypothetical protein
MRSVAESGDPEISEYFILPMGALAQSTARPAVVTHAMVPSMEADWLPDARLADQVPDVRFMMLPSRLTRERKRIGNCCVGR